MYVKCLSPFVVLIIEVLLSGDDGREVVSGELSSFLNSEEKGFV